MNTDPKYLRLLQMVGMAHAAGEQLDLSAISQELHLSSTDLEAYLEELERVKLIALGEMDVPMLLHSGKQYLALKGNVNQDVLRFLPGVIDDLYARRALLQAGTGLVRAFRLSIQEGLLVGHARTLVPPAFTRAVDEDLALSLFAAAVALTTRLSAGHSAGCIAEEILAVELIDIAKEILSDEFEDGDIDETTHEHAVAELRQLFELFEDDDVLDLFKMDEPADAAMAGHDLVNRQMGKADQRIEAWFVPFGGVIPTGYMEAEKV